MTLEGDPMNRFRHFCKALVLASCGGIMLMWGAGSCLPYNFYATLLGDSVTAFVSTIVGTVAGNAVPAN